MTVQQLIQCLQLSPGKKSLEHLDYDPRSMPAEVLLEVHRKEILDTLYHNPHKDSECLDSVSYRLGYLLLDKCERLGYFPYHMHNLPPLELLVTIPSVYKKLLITQDIAYEQRKQDELRFSLSKMGSKMRASYKKDSAPSPLKLVNNPATVIHDPATRLATLQIGQGYWGVFPTIESARRVAKELKHMPLKHKQALSFRSEEDVATSSLTPMTSLAPTEKVQATRDGYIVLSNHEQKKWLGPFGSLYAATKKKNEILCSETWDPYFESGTHKKGA